MSSSGHFVETDEEIASTAGVGVGTINRDLAKSDYANAYSEPVTNSRDIAGNKSRQMSENVTATHEDIIDADRQVFSSEQLEDEPRTSYGLDGKTRTHQPR